MVSLIGSATASRPASWPSTARNIDARASRAQRFGVARRAPARRRRIRCHQRRVAERRRALAVDRAAHADAGRGLERSGLREREPRARAAATIASASGCSLPWSRLAARRSTSSSSKPPTATARSKAGLPSVSVPVLSTIERVDLAQRLDRLGVAEQDAAASPRVPVATMIDIGVASPSAQGQAMISTATALSERVDPARLGPNNPQPKQVSSAMRDHGEHEPAGHRVRHALHRRPRALRLRDHLHDLRQHRLRADPLGAHDEAAACVDRRADHACRPGASSTGIGSPVSIDSSTLARAFQHDAVDRHLLAGAHAQPIADVDVGQRDVLLGAVGVESGAPSSAPARAAP